MPKTRCAATNEELAALAKAGDKTALHQLWEQNRGLLFSLFHPYFTVCRSPAYDSEDILQHGYFGPTETQISNDTSTQGKRNMVS